MEKIMVELPVHVYDVSKKLEAEKSLQHLGIENKETIELEDCPMYKTKEIVDINLISSIRPYNVPDEKKIGILIIIRNRELYIDIYYQEFIDYLRTKGVDIEFPFRR